MRVDDFEREISEARLRVQDVERSIETSIAALRHALEFIRAQNHPGREDEVGSHHARADAGRGAWDKSSADDPSQT